MSQLREKLANLKDNGKTGLIVYITGGYPDMAATVQAVLAAEKAGADIVEIGIPFSDPMADGPVIQKAAVMALQAGASTTGILAAIKEIRRTSAIPLAVMTYFNPVMQYGTAAFAKSAKEAGIDALIVPDLSFEETGELAPDCRANDLDFIQFVAPTTTNQRLQAICRQAAGFVYCISNTGVTGARDVDYSKLAPLIDQVKEQTTVPVAVGFGIASPAAAASAAKFADAVIVGSAVMDKLMDGGIEAMSSFIGQLRLALDKE